MDRIVETFILPPLRQELGISPAPPSSDGTPAWVLHDPPANRFYQLGWPAFEILSRWNLGTAASVLEAIHRETTLQITEDDIRQLLTFLQQNFLLDMSTRGSEQIAARLEGMKVSWPYWLLKNYLFFRFPLFRPQRFLDGASKRFSWLYTAWFRWGVVLAALIAMFLVSRQWDIFLHSFTAYRSWEGILILGIAISLAKTAHEFGHALTAHRYGCRIPAMGIAFVVLFPMLYTDTNEVWKLNSRRQRLAVGVAGMTTELILAIAATWAWILLPEGTLRAAAFVLATSTWLVAFFLNVSPFMRFDGYFVLCDLLGIPNLHPRSFAFGQWWLRERLFGLGDPPPEPATAMRQRFLIAFAIMTWLYRFFIFLGIAVLVYHYFFKALGLLLFSVEMWWFILRPIYQETVSWWKLRTHFRINTATIRTSLLLVVLILVLLVPWRGRVIVPAILSAAQEQQVFAPVPAMVSQEPVRGREIVHAGDTLIELVSPDLQQRIDRVRIVESVSRWQVEQQPFDEKMLSQGMVPQRRLEVARTELSGSLEEKDRLTMRAAFDGNILTRNDEIQPGLMLPAKEPLYVIVDIRKNKVEAFINAPDLKRIAVGNRARFLPDAPEFGVFDCRVTEIDRVNITTLEEPAIASSYGGPIATRADAKGVLYPSVPLFRVRLGSCNPEKVPSFRLHGMASIEAEKRSLIIESLRNMYAVLVRESGF